MEINKKILLVFLACFSICFLNLFPLLHSYALERGDDTLIDSLKALIDQSYLQQSPSLQKIQSKESSNFVSVLDTNSTLNFLDTKILEVRDGNNDLIKDGEEISTNSISFKIEAKNVFDVNGVICKLDQKLYPDCDIFNDPLLESGENDAKNCTIKQLTIDNEEELPFEICTFTINIDKFSTGQHDFSVTAFNNDKLEPQQTTSFTSKINIDSKDKILEERGKFGQELNNQFKQNFNDNVNQDLHVKGLGKVSELGSDVFSPTISTVQPSSKIDLPEMQLLSELNSNNDIQFDNTEKIIEDEIPKDTNVKSNINHKQFEKVTLDDNLSAGNITMDTTPTKFGWSFSADTIINSVIDGNNATINNNGNTKSDFVDFTFSAKSAEKPIEVDKFICSLDGQESVECSPGSHSYNDLEYGNHEFIVQAIIYAGDSNETKKSEPIVSTPANFNWNIFPETTIDTATIGNNDPIENETIVDSRHIVFSFSSILGNETNLVNLFECSIDNGQFEDCSDGTKTYHNLDFGTHIFKVKTLVEIGEGMIIEDPTPSIFIWNIGPHTVIESVKDGINNTISENNITESNQIKFNIFAEIEGEPLTIDRFQCSLDSRESMDCSDGSIGFDNLILGNHTFEVTGFIDNKESDEIGNSSVMQFQNTKHLENLKSNKHLVTNQLSKSNIDSKQRISITSHLDDPTTATFSWSVAPNTVINSAIDGNENELNDGDITTSNITEFTYSAESGGKFVMVDGFLCTLDNKEPIECSTNSIVTRDLTPGKHTLKVNAFFNDNGNIILDPTPALFSLFVAPNTIINSAIDGNKDVLDEGNNTASDFVEFTFSAESDGKPTKVDGFLCTLDNKEPIECSTNSITFENISPGKHTLKVNAFFNDNGNIILDPTPAMFRWYVDPNTIINSAIDGNKDVLDEGNNTASDFVEFTFSAESDGKPTKVDGFICKLDTQDPVNCSNGSISLNSLRQGEHKFGVSSFIIIDGKIVVKDRSPDWFSWTINKNEKNNNNEKHSTDFLPSTGGWNIGNEAESNQNIKESKST